MQAVRYHGPNEPLRLEQVPKPVASRPDDVVVKVHAAALCHTELHFADGTLNLGVKPMTLGHEAVGVIESVGSNVSDDRIGERVIVYYYQGCQTCRWCLHGQEQVCGALQAEFGFISDGGLAEYLLAPSRNAVVLPDTLDFVRAAPIGCGVTTAVHAAKLARIQGDKGCSDGYGADEWALIYGVNGVGFGLLQLLKNHFGLKVICVCRSEVKMQKCRDLGAEVVIDGTDVSTVAESVRKVTNGAGVDVLFECVGTRETLDASVGWAGCLGRRGRMVLIGYHDGQQHEFRCHPVPLIVYEQTVVGSVGATLEDLREAVAFVADGTIDTIVDTTIELKDFQEKGLDQIKSCKCVGKIVCVPQ